MSGFVVGMFAEWCILHTKNQRSDGTHDVNGMSLLPTLLNSIEIIIKKET